jgi:hypothetical protein
VSASEQDRKGEEDVHKDEEGRRGGKEGRNRTRSARRSGWRLVVKGTYRYSEHATTVVATPIVLLTVRVRLQFA